MRTYEFGDPVKPVILLLPGTCCHWRRTFGEVIPLLAAHFHVVCVSYDGFDETENTVFPDMLTETAKIEAYIKEHFGGRIHAAYGCSLGGSFVGLLIQRGNIHIRHGILGSSDLDQMSGWRAKAMAGITTPILHRFLKKGRLPGWMERLACGRQNGAYMEKMLALFFPGDSSMAFVQKESIHNQFYSDLVTPLESEINIPGTTVHCFYAVKMGTQYLERYRKHFRDPDIRQQDMEHEELLICHPKEWVELLEEVCGV